MQKWGNLRLPIAETRAADEIIAANPREATPDNTYVCSFFHLILVAVDAVARTGWRRMSSWKHDEDQLLRCPRDSDGRRRLHRPNDGAFPRRPELKTPRRSRLVEGEEEEEEDGKKHHDRFCVDSHGGGGGGSKSVKEEKLWVGEKRRALVISSTEAAMVDGFNGGVAHEKDTWNGSPSF
ncbi:hypothetical protein B296_00009733 [Ensete ventricosum]|uniref:Uncharacterized protein n=1 Tax=Ensete ventricosum TaxID=4639 RepID=A0A427AN24_ENSVE|nr:hypothetical protein B296_00009733 [Ensete ventricosum]